MSSYLSQFNYQFLTGEGRRLTLDEVRASAGLSESPSEGQKNGPRRWVFLHGLMGYGLNWQKIVKSLGPGNLSLIYDQRGHGQSFKPAEGYGPEDYAEDLDKITSELAWDKFVLVGHSMGGRNALIFADLHPEKLEKLVLEDIGPEASQTASIYYKNLLGAIPTPFASKLKAKEFFMNEFKKVPVEGDRETIGLYLYSNIVDTPEGRADWRFSKRAILDSVIYGREKDHWLEFERLSMPTLVIRGGDSETLSRETFQRMASSNPKVTAVEINNAGHWVHFNQAAEFVSALKSFVNDQVF